jgi:hypothetical protein
MKNIFSVEEINLMCIFDTSDKTKLIEELMESLPAIYDSDMREIYESTIEKLENISYEDFTDIGFFAADEFDYDGEE